MWFSVALITSTMPMEQGLACTSLAFLQELKKKSWIGDKTLIDSKGIIEIFGSKKMLRVSQLTLLGTCMQLGELHGCHCQEQLRCTAYFSIFIDASTSALTNVLLPFTVGSQLFMCPSSKNCNALTPVWRFAASRAWLYLAVFTIR